MTRIDHANVRGNLIVVSYLHYNLLCLKFVLKPYTKAIIRLCSQISQVSLVLHFDMNVNIQNYFGIKINLKHIAVFYTSPLCLGFSPKAKELKFHMCFYCE